MQDTAAACSVEADRLSQPAMAVALVMRVSQMVHMVAAPCLSHRGSMKLPGLLGVARRCGARSGLASDRACRTLLTVAVI